MDKKEWIKYFNKCFTTILNKFLVKSSPTDEVVVQYFTYALDPSISIFVKTW